MKSTKKTIATAIILFLPSVGFCSGLYFGGAAGTSNSGDAGSASELSYFTYTNVTQESSDTKDTALSVYMGYEFDFPGFVLGAEAGWIDFGENRLSAEGQDFLPGGDGRRTVDVSADADAITLSLLAKKEVADGFRVFGRLGISAWDVTGQLNGTVYDSLGSQTGSTSRSVSDSGTDPYFGIGVEYKFMRIGFDRYTINDTDTDFLYIGIKF